MTDMELAAIRKAAQKGSRHRSVEWIEQTAKRPGLMSILRNRGRPQVRFPENLDEKTDNES